MFFVKRNLNFKVYNPARTKFLKTAECLGYPTLNGLNMLLLQGEESYRLFTGEMPDLEVMKKVVESFLLNEI
ncbi:MAG: hypothetical protein IJT73_11955 [Selenomonadaceae bacterium]|nr:hypothetical protein [Selenomonadaceae bacterium]